MLATMTIPEGVITDLAAEVERARTKFPGAFNLNAALMADGVADDYC